MTETAAKDERVYLVHPAMLTIRILIVDAA
jgi:hypothetical protein